jgi:hypothetical protein
MTLCICPRRLEQNIKGEVVNGKQCTVVRIGLVAVAASSAPAMGLPVRIWRVSGYRVSSSIRYPGVEHSGLGNVPRPDRTRNR